MSDLRARLETSLSTTYRLERELGSGGMAVVYLARDLRNKCRVGAWLKCCDAYNLFMNPVE